jgi:hypothetical protein
VDLVDDRDEGGYVSMRRFENESDSDVLYAAVHEHDRWKNEIGPVVDSLLIREMTVVTLVSPAQASRRAEPAPREFDHRRAKARQGGSF